MLSVERGILQNPFVPRYLRRRRWAARWGSAFDLLAVLAVAVLAGLGVLNLYAVGGWSLALHQIGAVVGGLLLLVALRAAGPSLLGRLGWICYGAAVLLLLAVLVMGAHAYGASRWLAVGSLTFQPSELAKLGLLLVLAGVLGSGPADRGRFALAVLLAMVPIGLTVVEPDLSTTTLLVVLSLAMLILGRVPSRYLLPMLGAAAVAAPLAIQLLRPYQLARLRAFTSGTSGVGSGGGSGGGSASSWAVMQSHIALASGGLLGQAHSPLHRLMAEYLPDRETDLALSSLVEEWGFAAGAVALLAALVLVWRLALASRVSRTRHGQLVAAGLAVLLGAETLVSLGGNLGLLPVAGVPFPLLSYGGTAVAVHLAALGIVLGARRDGQRRQLWAAPRFLAPRPRLVRATALGTTLLLVVFAQYGWRLNASRGDSLRAAGQGEMTRCVAIPAPRGAITDRHGVPLAANLARDQVLAVPALLRSSPQATARLAALAGVGVQQLRQQLAGASATALSLKVAEVPIATGRRIQSAGITGTMVVPVPHRHYVYGPLLAPILGFAGIATPADVQRWPGLPPNEIVGRSAIEEEYDPVLRGVDGSQCVYVNPAGVPVAMGPRTAAVPGADLRLSLDLGLQRALTDRLASALHGSGGDMGGAVAMDPQNGQVLAMASLPSYDNNVYGPPVDSSALAKAASGKGEPMFEHVTQSTAPPGSTFKLVIASADMIHQALAPDTVIPTGSSWSLGNHTFNNWRSFGPMNLIQAIAWSNDVYFYQLAWKLGPYPMLSMARSLGVGTQTGIDLPGELSGYLGTPQTVHKLGATWYPGSTVILGIGQGYLAVTPLQDARWTAAVATGRMITPRLGLASGTPGGSFTALPVPGSSALPFSDRLGPVRAGMRAAVTSGTAAQLKNLRVAAGAKTGSSEDPSSPNHQPDSWFTAAAPLNGPDVVVTSFVRGGGEGAVTSGPVVDGALQYFLAHEAQILSTPSTDHH